MNDWFTSKKYDNNSTYGDIIGLIFKVADNLNQII